MKIIFGFLLTALYVPGISGAAVTPKWALLAIALPLFLSEWTLVQRWWGVIWLPSFHFRPLKITLPHVVGLAFLAWCALSLIWTPNRYDGANELIQLVILFEAFVLGASIDDNDIVRIFIGMACGLLLSSVTLFVQQWSPDIVLHATTYSGLYVNSAALAETAALVTIALLAMRGRYWQGMLVLGILPCLVMPESRCALLAIAAAFIVWLWSKSKFGAVLAMLAACLALSISLHLGFHVSSVVERINIWRDAIAGLNLLGHGIGSVWTDYAYLNRTFDIVTTRPEHLHNDFLEALFEFGWVGLVACCAVTVLWLRGQSGMAKLVAAGICAESLVDFPLHMPTTGFIAALICGALARDWPALRDVCDGGRVSLRRGRWRENPSADAIGPA
jgi:O-antigen ligase